MWVAVEYATGAALAPKDGTVLTLPTVSTDLAPQTGPDCDDRLAGQSGSERNTGSGLLSLAADAIGDGG